MNSTQKIVLLGTSYSAAARALFAAMTVQPTTARKRLINSTFGVLIGSGILPKLDHLYVLAAHDSQAALLNWVNPAVSLSLTASPTFTADRGYQGDAATSGLQTSTNMSTFTNFKQDTASMFGWSLTDAQSATADFGGVVAGSNSFAIIRTATNLINSRVNCASTSSIANTTGLGLFTLSRGSSADFNVYKNSVLLGTGSIVSTAVPGGMPFGICKGSTTFSARQMAAGGCGSALSASDVAVLYGALQNWMTTVGAA